MAIANQTKTIVGVFNSVQDANEAVSDLEALGISRGEISVVANKNATGYDTMDDRDKASNVVADAGIGAAIGGVGGLLLSAAGALTIPVIGPILAAGPIAAALTGAGIGAAAGGLIGALTESGIPEEDAKYYAEGVRRGDVLVTVHTDESQAERVCDVLDRHDAVDVDDRVQNWKSRGWSGWSETNTPYSPTDLMSERGYYQTGRTGGIGRESLPTPYDERVDRSTVGTTGMSTSNLAQGAREMGRDMKEGVQNAARKTGEAAREMKEDIKDLGRDREHDEPYATSSRPTGNDPRDKDKDGWVADDKMREWGRDVKDAVRGTGNELKDEARETKQRMEEAERRRRARVYDRTII
ncbi:MAG TPA: hypothetical protein VEX68_00660 [Bryobacteraceae bacterium]|nr:hypothetical protein [Bryobacteraceae bacterium]